MTKLNIKGPRKTTIKSAKKFFFENFKNFTSLNHISPGTPETAFGYKGRKLSWTKYYKNAIETNSPKSI